jgi:hypothetical protein
MTQYAETKGGVLKHGSMGYYLPYCHTGFPEGSFMVGDYSGGNGRCFSVYGVV